MIAQRMIIFGAGGHASDVLGVIEAINLRQPRFVLLGLVADDVPRPRRFEGRGAPHLGSLEECRAAVDAADEGVLAIGYPELRQRMWRQLPQTALTFPALVHPDATVETGVELGAGTVVLAGARLSPGSTCADHVSLARQVVVGHDVEVGPFCVLMPSATISGDVQIGEGVLVGTNATVLEGVTIGANAKVGAGAVVLHDVRPGSTVIGVPAREIEES